MELKVTCGLIDIGVGMNSGLRVVEEGDQSGPETVTASESAVGKLLPPPDWQTIALVTRQEKQTSIRIIQASRRHNERAALKLRRILIERQRT
jgi:hypothetical protein